MSQTEEPSQAGKPSGWRHGPSAKLLLGDIEGELSSDAPFQWTVPGEIHSRSEASAHTSAQLSKAPGQAPLPLWTGLSPMPEWTFPEQSRPW